MSIPAEGHKQGPDIAKMIERLDARLATLQMSDRKASIMATGLPDAIREIRRGKIPSDTRIRQLARALDLDPSYLAGFTEINVAHAAPSVAEGRAVEISLPKDIPVYAPSGALGMSANDDDSFMRYGFDLTAPVDFTTRLPKIWHRDDIFAILQAGNEMFPRYKEGDLLYVDPRRRPAIGEDAFVTVEHWLPDHPVLNRELERDAPHILDNTWGFVAEWRGRNVGPAFELEQYQPSCVMKLDDKRIKGVYRIIPYEELIRG